MEGSMVYLALIIFVLMGSAVVMLTLENITIEVPFLLFLWPIPQIRLGFLLVAAFLLGALMIYVISTLSALRDRREMKRLRKRLSTLSRPLVP